MRVLPATAAVFSPVLIAADTDSYPEYYLKIPLWKPVKISIAYPVGQFQFRATRQRATHSRVLEPAGVEVEPRI